MIWNSAPGRKSPLSSNFAKEILYSSVVLVKVTVMSSPSSTISVLVDSSLLIRVFLSVGLTIRSSPSLSVISYDAL